MAWRLIGTPDTISAILIGVVVGGTLAD